MHNAVVKGSETVGADAAHDGDNIEEVDSEGRTPLAHAAYEGHQAICGLLLENWASADAIRGSGITHEAVQEGKLMAVQQLLIVGADIEEVDPKGRTPVAYAVYKCQEAICKLLLEKGASVDAIRDVGSTMQIKGLMHKAVEKRSETVVQMLLMLSRSGLVLNSRSCKVLATVS